NEHPRRLSVYSGREEAKFHILVRFERKRRETLRTEFGEEFNAILAGALAGVVDAVLRIFESNQPKRAVKANRPPAEFQYFSQLPCDEILPCHSLAGTFSDGCDHVELRPARAYAARRLQSPLHPFRSKS